MTKCKVIFETGISLDIMAWLDVRVYMRASGHFFSLDIALVSEAVTQINQVCKDATLN